MTRKRQSGVSLLNVLAVLALGTGAVQIMLRDQEVAVDRLGTADNAAQARTLAHAGATSVAVALRRDFEIAPEADHLGEAWAQAAQKQIALEFGAFQVSVTDARGAFDLNALQPGAVVERRVFAALLAALDLPTTLASQITQVIVDHGPLAEASALLDHGFAPSDIDRLAPHVTTTSLRGTLNLNTVTPPLMAALLANPPAARGLISRRSANGSLTPNDLAALGVVQPPLSGFTSDAFDVRSEATVGKARATLARRLMRDPETGAIRMLPLP